MLPKKQYVLIRKRGRTTSYFFGTKLGTLVTTHLKVGEKFWYTFYVRQIRESPPMRRTGKGRYAQVGW